MASKLRKKMEWLIPRSQVQFEIAKQPQITGRRLVFNIRKRIGFSSAQTKRHISALKLGEQAAVNTKEYRDWLLSYKFTTVPTKNGKKLTNQEIYDIQMTGREKLDPTVDYEMDMDVTMYESNNRTVGYTYGNTLMVWVNNKFFKNYSLGEIFGNAWHEAQHKYGFDHVSGSDHTSVPYACGYKVRDMIEAYEKGARYTDLYPAIPSPEPTEVPIPTPKPVPQPVPPVETKKKVCKRLWYTLWLKEICWLED